MKVRHGVLTEEKREGAKVRRQMREGNRRRTGEWEEVKVTLGELGGGESWAEAADDRGRDEKMM